MPRYKQLTPIYICVIVYNLIAKGGERDVAPCGSRQRGYRFCAVLLWNGKKEHNRGVGRMRDSMESCNSPCFAPDLARLAKKE